MDYRDRKYVRETLRRTFLAMRSLTGEREGEFVITNKALARFIDLYSKQLDYYWSTAKEETLLNYWEKRASDFKEGLMLAAKRGTPGWEFQQREFQQPEFQWKFQRLPALVISEENVEAVARLCPPQGSTRTLPQGLGG